MDNACLKKFQQLLDDDLAKKLDSVIERQADEYARINGRSCFDLLAEASIKMCDEANQAIKEEQKKRNINSRKA